MSVNLPLANMSPLIRGITIILLLLPIIFGIIGILFKQSALNLTAILLILIYSFVWLVCKPSQFIITSNNLQIVFPVWSRNIPIERISNIRIITAKTFTKEFGWAIRIGAGGLWGGFGWLWTKKKGFVEFYISTTDYLIIIEHSNQKKLLITPNNPEQMLKIIQEIRSQ